MLEFVTFFLAVLGYAGLATTAVLATHGGLPRGLWRVTALVIVTHVVLVWAVRYDWSVASATRNGYAPFVIFHGALAIIVVSLLVPESAARRLVQLVFGIVTLGALGAVFSEPLVAHYRIPVVVIALGGVIGSMRAAWRRRAAT